MVKKTTKKAKVTQKKAKKAETKAKARFGWFKKTLLMCFVFFIFLLSSYIGYLDYNVTKQFEGKRWALPAHVYASPVELYVGSNLSAKEFESLLKQLHYRKDARISSDGSYYRSGDLIKVRTHSFKFWDQKQDSLDFRVSFASSGIDRMVNLKNNDDLAIVRLEPVQIGSFYPTRKEDRILIKLEDAPDSLIQGLLSTEDRDFYHHYGVSFKAILRAMWANLKAGGIVQGGSTITQQLVKNFYLTPERSLWRKLNEALMALILEYRYDKDEILEAYLNEVYLGQNGASSVHGFGLASQFYFGMDLKQLPLHQVAGLVALVRGPSYYDPRRYQQRSLKRRNLVLEKMHQQGYITKKQMLAAQKKALSVIPLSHRSVNRYPAFLDLVKRQLRQEYREEDLTSEGLRIFTTLEIGTQNLLEKTTKQGLKQLEKRPKVNKLQTAAVVTRRGSGEIVALSGGRKALDAGFNRALDAVRPIGSLIKPVVYLTALEYPDRYTITTLVDDSSIEIKDYKGEVWRPQNYDKQEHGEVELHTALTHSYNQATVRIGMDVGIARTVKTLRNLGVKRPVNLYPSFLLGAAPLTPLEVTQMYQTLAGDGFATPLRAIRAVIANDGERLNSYPYTVRQTVDPAATYIINTMLQEVMYEGTGRSAYSVMPMDLALAGKTGTTNGLRDSWFSGFSGDYLAVFWIGRDDNKPAGLTGASGALKLWTRLMSQVSNQPVALMPPDNIEQVWIDPANGLLANEQCQGARRYPYIKGSAPYAASPCMNSPVNRTRGWLKDFFQ